MLLRILVISALVLAMAKHYFHDSKSSQPQVIKPKQQIENIEQQLEQINIHNQKEKDKALEALGL